MSESVRKAPLVGYNTNVRHRGQEYHIQTEDFGSDHATIISQIFVEGGRVIHSQKTSYKEYVGQEGYANVIRKLMQEQHKAMFLLLKNEQTDVKQPQTPIARGDATEVNPIATQDLPPTPQRKLPRDTLEVTMDMRGFLQDAAVVAAKTTAEDTNSERKTDFPPELISDEDIDTTASTFSEPPQGVEFTRIAVGWGYRFGDRFTSNERLDQLIAKHLSARSSG